MAYTQTMLAANTPVKYSLKLVEILYNETIYTKVTNTDYDGEIKNEGDRVRVRTLGKVVLSTYTKGMTLAGQDLAPIFEDLIVDKASYFKFPVDDIDKLQNDINTINEYAALSKQAMQETLDTDVLTYMAQNVHPDSLIGTTYNTGTGVVTTGTGACVGTGTTWTNAMVGSYWQSATGHSTKYIVTSVTSATAAIIADIGTVTGVTSGTYAGGNLILAGGTYSGGAASGTATLTAATPVAVTKANIYSQIVLLRTKLGQKLTPKEGRFLVVNAEFEGILLQAPEFIPAVGVAYEDAVKGARIGRIGGFDVYSSELVPGNNTQGYFFIAGTRDFCAMALQIMKTSISDSSMDPATFTSTVKGLLVWGKKVFAGNRGRGAALRATLA
jgi:hypothetical protein